MKLLVYDWKLSYLVHDVYDVLKQMGISYDVLEWDFNGKSNHNIHDEEFVSYFINNVDTSQYDAVFSSNFWPPIAEATYKKNIKYISFNYDCPLDLEDSEETLNYPNIYAFFFDKMQVNDLRNRGFENAYYMPLGINPARMSKITPELSECDKYRSDVTFVGVLYENDFWKVVGLLDDKTKDVLNKIVQTQRNVPPGVLCAEQVVTDSFAAMINEQIHNVMPDFQQLLKKHISFAILTEAARYDRITLLNLCGRRYKTNFYSSSKFDVLEGVNCFPYVNYYETTPYVFAAARINLNPVLPAIHSGMNLRCFDITSCGGLLLMNRQPEFNDFFEEGKEAVVYDSLADAIDKIDYLLKHEDERKRIALAGRQKTLSEHTLNRRFADIFKASGVE